MLWDGEKSARLRRQSPITGYIGANGSGKSLLAVNDARAYLDSGRRVMSTVRLIDPLGDPVCSDEACTFAMHPNHGTAHPNWLALRSWQDLLDAEGCHILLDEITGIASSRESQGLPPEVADRMMQFRRQDVTVAWTAPSWARADLLLREVTQCAVMAKGLFRKRAAGQVWRASSVISSKMVDARELDELTQAQRMGTARAPLSVMVRGYQKVERTAGRNYYNTLDSVLALNRESAKAGACLTCGGRRAAPRCECSSAPGPGARRSSS